jgi:hypothetical protein
MLKSMIFDNEGKLQTAWRTAAVNRGTLRMIMWDHVTLCGIMCQIFFFAAPRLREFRSCPAPNSSDFRVLLSAFCFHRFG